MGRVEVEPGSIAQVKRALSGRLVAIPDDVCGVARDLRAIDRRLRVEAEDDLSVYIVFLEEPDGSRQLVTTAQHLDKRIVDRVRQVADERYDFAGELDKIEAAADRAFEARRQDQLGDFAERLGHAFRKDLGRHEAPNTLRSRAAGFALKD
jgi:hypothetical protein